MADIEKLIIDVEAKTEQVVKLRGELKKLRDERKKLEKNQDGNKKRLMELDSEIRKNNEQLKRNNQTLTKHTQLIISEANSIEQLRKKTNLMVQQRDRLNLKTKQGKKEYEQLTRQINRQTNELKKHDKAIGRSQRNVGNYASAFSGLAGAMGVTLGAAGIFSVLRNSTQVIKDFGKQASILASILNTTRDGVKELTDQAVELAVQYPTLTGEVIQLQTAYARLGFTQSEIINLTEGTIQGSIALNAELGDTAALTGAVVRAFDNLISTDATYIMDQLTASTQKSSLSFEGLQTALPKVAGAANAMNISLDKSLALLSIAQDATQDASIAGTSLRKIFLTLAKEGLTLDEALNKINVSTNKTKVANELFGDRAAITALALANNRDRAIELEKAYRTAGGTAQYVAETQMDNLQGATDKLASAWEGFVLKAQKSEGLLKQVVESIATAINLIGMSDEEIKEQSAIEVATEQFKQFEIQFRETVEAMNDDSDDFVVGLQKGEKEVKTLHQATMEYLTTLKNDLSINEDELKNVNKQIETYKKLSFTDEQSDMYDIDGLEKYAEELEQIIRLKKAQTKVFEEQAEKQDKAITLQIENEINERKKQDDDIKESERIRAERAIETNIQTFEKLIEINKLFVEDSKEIRAQLYDDLAIMGMTAADGEIEIIKRKHERERVEIENQMQFRKGSILDQENYVGKFYENQIEWEKLSGDQRLEIIADVTGQAAQIFEENTIGYQLLASAQALINTYLSASKAYNAFAAIPPLAIAAAAVATAQGLALVAKINGVKFDQGGALNNAIQLNGGVTPQFAKGALLTGASHANGGIQMFGRGGYYGEAEGGEIVLTKGVASDPVLRGVASDINQLGGGRRLFASGAVLSPATQTIINKTSNNTLRETFTPVLVVNDVTELQNIKNAVRLMAVD